MLSSHIAAEMVLLLRPFICLLNINYIRCHFITIHCPLVVLCSSFFKYFSRSETFFILNNIFNKFFVKKIHFLYTVFPIFCNNFHIWDYTLVLYNCFCKRTLRQVWTNFENVLRKYPARSLPVVNKNFVLFIFQESIMLAADL